MFDKNRDVKINPFVEGLFKNINSNETLFGILTLANNLRAGKYYVIPLLERNTLGGQTDYSSEKALKLFNDLIQNKIDSETDLNNRLLDIQDKKEFLVGFNAKPEIKLTGIYSVYGNDATQEGLELSADVDIKGNVDRSDVNISIDFGDGIENETAIGRYGDGAKHSYKLPSKIKDKYFEITAKVFYNSTQIGSSSTGITVYKDLPPVAIAKYDEEHYETSGDLPFKAGFIDKSYDPNDELTGFNGLLDKTISKNNIWKLFKYTDGASGQIINTEDLSVTSNQVLNDGKTFLTGNVLNPGTYYAGLTVFDRGGNSDTTKSQTFQVLLPTQMLLVYATFDNPNHQAFEYDLNSEVKIQFKSEIDIRGKQPRNIIYKWDFGENERAIGQDGKLANLEHSNPNPIHIYKKGNNYSGMIDYSPDLTVTAIWNNGYSETWTSCAGTVSIIDKPEFVAIELLPDITIGNIPLTVNFMISDRSFAKNATILSYEFDFGDGSPLQIGSIPSSQLSSPRSSLDELKKITFTHTYTTRGDFIPTLKVKIKENPERVITIGVPIVLTSSLLVSSIEVVEPQDNFITNQPIQTFKIRTQYTNPFSDGNRLTIHVTDEDGIETVTELDPSSLSQTISLSEGVNSYWFELVDSTGAVQKSLTRKVALDTNKSFLEITSPSENELIGVNDKVVVSGVVEDELFESITYKVNSNNEIKINNDELEELGDGKKAFNFTLDPSLLNIQIEKIEIIAKDKAGNLKSQVINAGLKCAPLSLAQKTEDGATLVYNDGKTYDIFQGNPFKLINLACICDDKDKSVKEPFGFSTKTVNAQINISSFTNTIDTNIFSTNIPGDYQTGETEFQNFYGCGYKEVFKSAKLNNINSVDGNFLITSPGGDPTFFWPQGNHKVNQKVDAIQDSRDQYGTTFEDGNISTTSVFMVNITSPYSATIKGLETQNIRLKELNNINFNLNISSVVPFENTSSKLPQVNLNSFTLTTPSGKIITNDKLSSSLSCTITPNQTFPTNELLESCSFSITPLEYTSETKQYSLHLPITFPLSESIKNNTADATGTFVVGFETPLVITTPESYALIESKNYHIKSELDRSNLPANLKSENDIKNLAKYGIKLPYSTDKSIRPLVSKENIDSIIKGVDISITKDKVTFDYNLNFNLSTNTLFENDFKNLSAIGPIYLFNSISNLNGDGSFSVTNPLPLVLLDKLMVLQSSSLKNNPKTNKNVLKVLISSNAGLGNTYPVEVQITPKDINGNIVGNEINSKHFIGKPFVVNDLSPEVNSVVVTVNRSSEFLSFVQEERIKKEGWTHINLLGDYKYKHGQTKIITLKDKLTTNCEVIPGDLTLEQSAVFAYKLKSAKTFGLSAFGYTKEDPNTPIPIPDITKVIDISKRFQDAVNGNIDFTCPQEWSIFSQIKLILSSGGESDECVLKIGSKAAFEIGDREEKTATFDGKTISVKELNKLLFDLGYLLDPNQGSYTTNTRDAFGKLIKDYSCLITNDLGNLRYQTLQGHCEITDFSNFKATFEELKIALKIQDFMKGIFESNAELYHEIKNNPTLATFVIGFSIAAGVIITAGSAGIDAYIATVLAELGAVGVLTQIEDIKNKLAGYFNESDSFKAGYIFGEVGKFVGLAVVIGFASKGLTNLNYTIQGIKQAQILSEQGHKDLANAIYEQVSRINNAADDVKVGLQKGLDGVLKTVDDIQTGEIFKDFQRLWTEVTQVELQNIKSYALKLFNDIVAKMQQQEELFKIYETDPGGYETGIIRNSTYDQNLKEAVERLNLDLPKEVANAISAKVNGLISDLTQKFVNDGFTLIGRTIPKDQVPQRLSTVMKVSDLRYLLKGTKFENETNEDVILAAIKSEEITIEKFVGEISGKSKLRWWTDSVKLEELKQTGKYTKEFINGDEGLALDYDLTKSKALIRIDIDTNNLPDKFFHIPISTEGGYKFVPSTYNLLNRSGKTKGDFLELTSPPVNADKASGYVKLLDIIN